ncbi:hypothetical protein CHR53_23995 [Neobacillus mesonae]|uniref:Uncharacterized protein n=1 Tax=Neobacillus mesonae TaxID=1193713 RepID=A0A3T0I437_9BACI|nr:hypothetical protein CHR53_23995 [Neobacillus mesonae]
MSSNKGEFCQKREKRERKALNKEQIYEYLFPRFFLLRITYFLLFFFRGKSALFLCSKKYIFTRTVNRF